MTNQIWSAAALCTAAFLATGTANAQETASTEAVYSCAEIDEIEARLACYDEAVGRLQVAEEAGEITTITKEEVEQAERDSFGLSLPSLSGLAFPGFGNGDDDDEEEDRGVETITAGVVNIRESAYGDLIVTLDNGSVWRQIDSKNVFVGRSGVESATVERASMGSYRMSLDGRGRFTVRREE
ncbi:MAG: hypothetical protein AAF216_07870 [Pseudomonadota bacterium]